MCFHTVLSCYRLFFLLINEAMPQLSSKYMKRFCHWTILFVTCVKGVKGTIKKSYKDIS